MALTLPTGRRGQALALAISLLVAALFWVAVIAPILSWYDDRAEGLRRQQAMARRMASLVDKLPSLEREASSLSGSGGTGGAGGGTPTGLLPGATDALAAAWLQQRIDEFAATAGMRVSSEEILPGQAESGLRPISVRLTVSARYDAIVGFLLALARSDVPIVADELIMRAAPGQTRENELPVDATLTVMSHRLAGADPR